MNAPATDLSNAIAIIGMAGRFPGARSVHELWDLLRNGREGIRRLSEAELRAAGVPGALIADPSYVRAAATLDGMDEFDADFFGFSPRDAAIMDPQHRHFLECAWEALESAGHTPESFTGAIGIFGGCGMQSYFARNLLNNAQLLASAGLFLVRHTGNDKDFLTTRVSYQLNLTGPSVNVQTACSTSLVAVHMATQSLLNGECDMALAGGVTIEIPHGHGYLYEEGEILSPDGHCRAFDAASQGIVFGSGAGLVELRRLEDAIAAGDHVHAVVIGSAVNNDGAGKVGYLAPSVDGQAAVIAEAIGLAGVDPESIEYIETHGTGTPVGDPIEIAALTNAYRRYTNRRGFCAIGSIKTNIGHLDTAAGVASLIKATRAVETGQLPPSLHFSAPNPAIPFDDTPFFVNRTLRSWDSQTPRRAGVTALGVGGTNAHVILEQAPANANQSDRHEGSALLLISTRTAASLTEAAERLARHLRDDDAINLSDAAYTLRVGRRPFEHRLAVVAASADAAAASLDERAGPLVRTGVARTPAPSIAFMFPGGGAQYPGMAAELYSAEPTFKKHFDECLASAAPQISTDIAAIVVKPSNSADAANALERPSVALPALFAIEYSLTRLLESWGILPACTIGHSLGEYVSACLAGVFSVKDGLHLVTRRGQLFEQLPAGSMISVPLSPDDIAAIGLPTGLSIAAINGPALSVVSGPSELIDRFTDELRRRDIDCRRLRIAVAAHSRMLDGILDEFLGVVRSIRLSAPTMPFISNVTGTWIEASAAVDPQYWVQHLRQTVQFSAGVGRLLDDPNRLLVEVGPGSALTSIARIHLPPDQVDRAISTMGRANDDVGTRASVLAAAGQLWVGGIELSTDGLFASQRRVRIPLPTYPFERSRHWIDADERPSATPVRTDAAERAVSRWLQIPIWTKSPRPSAAAPALRGTRWLVVSDSGVLSDATIALLREQQATVTTVTFSSSFANLGADEYAVDPADAKNFGTLLNRLQQSDMLPSYVLYLAAASGSASDAAWSETAQSKTFEGLLHLAQALADHADRRITLVVATEALHRVIDEPVTNPIRGLSLGALRVIARELTHIDAKAVDMEPTHPENATAQAQSLIAEVIGPYDVDLVALRSGTRWTQSFAPLPPSGPSNQLDVRARAVILITGGLGGIALTLAERLAREMRPRFVLVARSNFPEPGQWSHWLDSHASDDPTSVRIRQLQRIEGLGASIRLERADLTDATSVHEVVTRTHADLGPIAGVIHAAGTLDDKLLQLKTAAEAASVLGPKVAATLHLSEALASTRLDFWVNCSSISSLVGVAGQIDYAAANAFLDAFSVWRSSWDGGHTVAVNWGPWRDVGMLAAPRPGPTAIETTAGERPPQHATFVRESGSDGIHTFTRVLSASTDWILDEHRLADGRAVLPGSAYLDILAAAGTQLRPRCALEIGEVAFLTPLTVDADARQLSLTIEEETGSFSIRTVANGESLDSALEHATGSVRAADSSEPAPLDVAAIRARCRHSVPDPIPNLRHLRIGPRWQQIRVDVSIGEKEACATIALADRFSGDVVQHVLHPALLDVATSFALRLSPAYDPDVHFFVPLSYGRVIVYGPLETELFCHAMWTAASGAPDDLAVFDLTIASSSGTPLCRVERFVTKRLDIRAGLQVPSADSKQASTVDLTDAIRPVEGADAFRLVLAALPLSQIVVVPRPIAEVRDQATRTTSSQTSVAPRTSRTTAFEEPRDDLDRSVVSIWSEFLGIDQIGIDDNFFELGGHSLLLTQVGSRIRRATGVTIPLAQLFEQPTVRGMADRCRQRGNTDDEPALVAVPRDQLRRPRQAFADHRPVASSTDKS